MDWYEITDNMVLTTKLNSEYGTYGFYPQGRRDACYRTGLAVFSGWHIEHPELVDGLEEMLRLRIRYTGFITPEMRKATKYPKAHSFRQADWVSGIAGMNQANPYRMRKLGIPFALGLRKVWRPSVLFWSLYLKYQRNSFKWLYFASMILSYTFLPRKAFRLHLDALMNYTVPNRRLTKLIRKRTPQWNLGIRSMTGDMTVNIDQVYGYRPKSRYQWELSQCHEDNVGIPCFSYLDGSEEIRLDQDVMIFCWRNPPRYED